MTNILQKGTDIVSTGVIFSKLPNLHLKFHLKAATVAQCLRSVRVSGPKLVVSTLQMELQALLQNMQTFNDLFAEIAIGI